MPYWVYILKCSDGSYYTGHTNDLEKRVAEHQSGEIPGYTSKRRPVRLVFCEEMKSRQDVFARERQIKGWSRKKKEALIKGDWNELSRLSKGTGYRD
ncbi:MAG: hypothetical protein NPIRA01_08200 [Nitrospirales bacterium]|nr:MAG: hypothetical protein NPIRA01_08200 [Nitrospirales bacterium]